MSHPVTLKGTVTDFRFMNPHSLVFFDLKNDKGEVEHWQGELTAPNKLARAGWTKHRLNPAIRLRSLAQSGRTMPMR